MLMMHGLGHFGVGLQPPHVVTCTTRGLAVVSLGLLYGVRGSYKKSAEHASCYGITGTATWSHTECMSAVHPSFFQARLPPSHGV